MGKIKTVQEMFYDVEDVRVMLGYSKSKAYQVIADLNRELAASGICTRNGMIPKKYFERRYGLAELDPKAGRRAMA